MSMRKSENVRLDAAPIYSRLADAANGYAARGWPVFVLGRSKRPLANCKSCRDADPSTHDREACSCLTCHGFYAATTNPDRLTAMLDKTPAAMLAVRTGAVSGLLVVDIDPRHDGYIDATLMNRTYHVATGATGWHLYYQHPGCTIPSRPMHGKDGVDIKADGGYVIAPPSIHPITRRPYRTLGDQGVEEMRPALRAAILRSAVPNQPSVTKTPTVAIPRPVRGGRISHPQRLLQANLDAIKNAPAGRRRVTLYGAARGAARIILTGAISYHDAVAALTDAGHAIGQPERDIHAAITGGFHDEGLIQ